MSESTAWTLVSAVCVGGGCQLVYRSVDGVVGLHRTSSRGRPDRTRYFVWALPDSAPTYATEAEARAAAACQTEPGGP